MIFMLTKIGLSDKLFKERIAIFMLCILPYFYILIFLILYRDTATSAGPNSFGKDSKRGFCDTKKVFGRQLNKALEESSD